MNNLLAGSFFVAETQSSVAVESQNSHYFYRQKRGGLSASAVLLQLISCFFTSVLGGVVPYLSALKVRILSASAGIRTFLKSAYVLS